MSNLLNKAGNKVLNKVAKGWVEKNIPPPTDPVWEFYEDSNGRLKKRKRPTPPGLSTHDADILKAVRSRARRLDQGMNLCGLRFGWTFIIGLIPGAGDAADAVLGYLLVIRKAKQADIPTSLIFSMLKNTAISTAVGTIPFAGDVFIAAYKSNSRNAMLLERYLTQRGAEILEAKARADAKQAEEARAAARASAEEEAGPVETRMLGDAAGAAEKKPERWPTSFFMRKRSSKKQVNKENMNMGDDQRKGRFVEHVEEPRGK